MSDIRQNEQIIRSLDASNRGLLGFDLEVLLSRGASRESNRSLRPWIRRVVHRGRGYPNSDNAAYRMDDNATIEARRVRIAELARTASPDRPLLAALRCGFCGAKGSKCEHIFAGTTAFICDQCVGALGAALAERRRRLITII